MQQCILNSLPEELKVMLMHAAILAADPLAKAIEEIRYKAYSLGLCRFSQINKKWYNLCQQDLQRWKKSKLDQLESRYPPELKAEALPLIFRILLKVKLEPRIHNLALSELIMCDPISCLACSKLDDPHTFEQTALAVACLERNVSLSTLNCMFKSSIKLGLNPEELFVMLDKKISDDTQLCNKLDQPFPEGFIDYLFLFRIQTVLRPFREKIDRLTSVKKLVARCQTHNSKSTPQKVESTLTQS